MICTHLLPQTSHSHSACVVPDFFHTIFHRYSDIIPHVYTATLSPSITHPLHLWLTHNMGWVGLRGFLWWAPSAKGKDHHGVSSGWSSVWHCSNTGLSSSQFEHIPIILGVWPFCLTPFFFRSITFGGLMVKLYFLCWNYSLSSGWHIIAA